MENGWIIGEFDEIESQFSSADLDVEICRRRMNNVRREIFDSYDKLRIRSENLNQAKRKILRYLYYFSPQIFQVRVQFSETY